MAEQLFVCLPIFFLTPRERRKMSLRFISSSLFFTLKNCSKISCDREIYSRFYNNHCRKNNQVRRRSEIPGKLFYSTKAKCWQCNSEFEFEFFCEKCKVLVEPSGKVNYFQIIGVQQKYDLDGYDLQRKYKNLQNILHPDRFSNKSEKEQCISERISSLINEAYHTLSHPLDRGMYILKLRNKELEEGTAKFDHKFLMEIMEINEKVEEASRDKEKIVRLLDQNNDVLDKLSKEVSAAFRRSDFERAKIILMKMKYYDSLRGRLKKFKQELGIVDD